MSLLIDPYGRGNAQIEKNMNIIKINNITVKENRLDIEYKAEGEWIKYFKGNHFFCEYDTDISQVSKAIAVVPFLGNILPVVWFVGGSLYVNEIDNNFYQCLSAVKRGYETMYPQFKFRGEVIAEHLVDAPKSIAGRNAIFYSGGVDANYTLLNHLNEHPDLVTVWGSDISLEDTHGWQLVKNMIDETKNKYKISGTLITSNFRKIINTSELNLLLNHKGWNWWHEFQHGIGLLTLLAPASYVKGYDKVYIASSCTADIPNWTCASDPKIDNFVRFAHSQVIHDGYEAGRQNKINFIVDFAKKNHEAVKLHVCWISKGGKNCCICEKCCRTMMGIWMEGENPASYGFENKNSALDKIGRHMKYRNLAEQEWYWEEIWNKMKEKDTLQTIPASWKWFYKGGPHAMNANPVFRILNTRVIIYDFFRKIKHKLRETLWHRNQK